MSCVGLRRGSRLKPCISVWRRSSPNALAWLALCMRPGPLRGGVVSARISSCALSCVYVQALNELCGL